MTNLPMLTHHARPKGEIDLVMPWQGDALFDSHSAGARSPAYSFQWTCVGAVFVTRRQYRIHLIRNAIDASVTT
jgi:hypothetical protein